MRYKKPIIVEISSRARSKGWNPACINGNGAGDWCCVTGTSGIASTQPCNSGGNPGTGVGGEVCVSGVGPGFGYCNLGTSGQLYGDICTSGPAGPPS